VSTRLSRVTSRTAGRCLAGISIGLLTAMMCAPTPALAADPEGGSAKLRKTLSAANTSWAQAKARLGASKKRQKLIDDQLKRLQSEHTTLEDVAAKVAARAYRNGRLTEVSLILQSDTPDSFLSRATAMDNLARADSGRLGRLTTSTVQIRGTKTALDAEVAEQTKQVAIMAKRREDALAALAEAGGGGATGGFISANSPLASAAKRNPDGSWPNEGCSINDPTTDGCITPRTLHALQQAQSDGFNHFVSCHRNGGSGEHPLGRACDFAAAKGGFENVAATGADKEYGDRLASYFLKNADRLGVMYVIWYRQIWMPSTGWQAYQASGGPAEVHTNHVHLSML